MICTILIEGKEIKADSNSNLLWAALDNGFYIPNLCNIKDAEKPSASCRLCFVEIEGRRQPIPACTEIVADGISVTINSPKITRLRKASFDLLMSSHRTDCTHCVKNRKCGLQVIAHAEHFRLNDRRFNKIDRKVPVDTSHPLFDLDRNKCVVCGKCVWACHKYGKGILDFAYRAIKTTVSTFADISLSQTACNSCLACVDVCPVGALYRK